MPSVRKLPGSSALCPVALKRPDLRLVHACWDDDRLDELRVDGDGASAVELYRLHALRSDARARESGLAAEVEALLERYGRELRDPAARVPMLDALAARDVDCQMSNPVRVLTSGTEHRADAPFFMAGKWRMVQRRDWWEQYRSPIPVLFGHYWRWPEREALFERGSGAAMVPPRRVDPASVRIAR